MNIDLIVLKTEVMDMVDSMALYTGDKTDTGDRDRLKDRVGVKASDSSLMAGYWRDSCAHIVDALRNFISSVSFGQETLRMQLEVSAAYDDTLTPSVLNGVFSHIAASILARWFALTFPEKSEEWARQAIAHFDCVLANLYHRRKPKRNSDKN